MLSEPTIVTTRGQTTAVIHLSIPRAAIQAAMGEAIAEVLRVVGGQGIGPVGPVFAFHHGLPPNLFDFEVGVPVRAPVQPTGRVMPSALPAGTVAHAVYTGPYEGLSAAWAEFSAWFERSGHPRGDDFLERYESGPGESADPTTWRTELCIPLAERPA